MVGSMSASRFSRASLSEGADVILTYFARQAARWLADDLILIDQPEQSEVSVGLQGADVLFVDTNLSHAVEAPTCVWSR